jgi:amino acid permease
MYIFDGNAIVVNIRAEAKEKKRNYPKILKKAVIFTICLFVVYSVICYSVYRDQTKPIFTNSLVPINSLVVFILSCVSVNALTSYPVQILAAFNIVEKFEVCNWKTQYNIWYRFTQKMGQRIAVIMITTVIAYSVTTFTDFINIAGSVGSVSVGFILPEILYLKVFGHKLPIWKKVGCVSISILGVVGGTYSVVYSLQKMARNDLS